MDATKVTGGGLSGRDASPYFAAAHREGSIISLCAVGCAKAARHGRLASFRSVNANIKSETTSELDRCRAYDTTPIKILPGCRVPTDLWWKYWKETAGSENQYDETIELKRESHYCEIIEGALNVKSFLAKQYKEL